MMKSGSDALLDYREKYKSVYTISGLLSAKQGEISSAVERLMNDNDIIRRDFYQFKMSVAENTKSSLVFLLFHSLRFSLIPWSPCASPNSTFL